LTIIYQPFLAFCEVSDPTPKFDFSVLRTLRDQRELTLAALSEASGVSVVAVS